MLKRMRADVYIEVDENNFKLCSKNCNFLKISKCSLYNKDLNKIHNYDGMFFERNEQCLNDLDLFISEERMFIMNVH